MTKKNATGVRVFFVQVKVSTKSCLRKLIRKESQFKLVLKPLSLTDAKVHFQC